MASEEGFGMWQLIFIALVLIIPVLYTTNHVFKYWFKMVSFYTLSLFIGVGVILYSLPRPRNTENHFFVVFMVKKFLMKLLGVEVTVRGEDKLKQQEPAILCINHQSSVDMLPLFYTWPKNTVCLAKKELWYFGTFGLGAWLCGTVYIDRLNHERARKTMEDTANLIKTNKFKVAIFPEGTRNHKGSLLPFKKGAFHLAVQGQVPVIPIVFSSYDTFYNRTEKRFDEGRVLVEVLPPIPTTGLTAEDVTDLTEKTRNVMLEAYDRISEEVKTMK